MSSKQPTEIQATQKYMVIDIEEHPRSQFDGKPYWVINAIGLDDRVMYKTYIQIDNKNFAHWQKIFAKQKKGILMSFDRFRFARKGDNVINADCKPITYDHGQGSKEQLTDLIADKWDEIDRGQFGQLFDIS